MVFSVGDTELYYKVMGQGPPGFNAAWLGRLCG